VIISATNGTNNTGGGGGGAAGCAPGGTGGTGIVILTVPSALYSGVYTGNPQVTPGSVVTLTYTQSGTYKA
jgi:hypothetical protein